MQRIEAAAAALATALPDDGTRDLFTAWVTGANEEGVDPTIAGDLPLFCRAVASWALDHGVRLPPAAAAVVLLAAPPAAAGRKRRRAAAADSAPLDPAMKVSMSVGRVAPPPPPSAAGGAEGPSTRVVAASGLDAAANALADALDAGTRSGWRSPAPRHALAALYHAAALLPAGTPDGGGDLDDAGAGGDDHAAVTRVIAACQYACAAPPTTSGTGGPVSGLPPVARVTPGASPLHAALHARLATTPLPSDPLGAVLLPRVTVAGLLAAMTSGPTPYGSRWLVPIHFAATLPPPSTAPAAAHKGGAAAARAARTAAAFRDTLLWDIVQDVVSPAPFTRALVGEAGLPPAMAPVLEDAMVRQLTAAALRLTPSASAMARGLARWARQPATPLRLYNVAAACACAGPPIVSAAAVLAAAAAATDTGGTVAFGSHPRPGAAPWALPLRPADALRAWVCSEPAGPATAGGQDSLRLALARAAAVSTAAPAASSTPPWVLRVPVDILHAGAAARLMDTIAVDLTAYLQPSACDPVMTAAAASVAQWAAPPSMLRPLAAVLAGAVNAVVADIVAYRGHAVPLHPAMTGSSSEAAAPPPAVPVSGLTMFGADAPRTPGTLASALLAAVALPPLSSGHQPPAPPPDLPRQAAPAALLPTHAVAPFFTPLPLVVQPPYAGAEAGAEQLGGGGAEEEMEDDEGRLSPTAAAAAAEMVEEASEDMLTLLTQGHHHAPAAAAAYDDLLTAAGAATDDLAL